MANIKISAVDVEKIWYADYTKWLNHVGKITGADVAALLRDSETREVENVHQDTWQLEEAEASQDKYKNQLTGAVYRMGSKDMGDITVAFTIGRYDYVTKAELLGGDVEYVDDTYYGATANASTLFRESGEGHTIEVKYHGKLYKKENDTGEYSKTKTGDFVVEFEGGKAVGWSRARGIVEMRKILIARTEDKQYVIYPQASFNVREANTDKAIGLAVSSAAMEPDNTDLSSEYWYDESVVK